MRSVKLIALLFVMAVAAAVRGEDENTTSEDYIEACIYWKVVEAPQEELGNGLGPVYFDYATITPTYANGDEGVPLAMYSFDDQDWTVDRHYAHLPGGGGPVTSFDEPFYSGIFNANTVQSFIVRLYLDNDDYAGGTEVGSTEFAYNQALAHIFRPEEIGGTGQGAYSHEVWATPTPEPTSGLLLLFGVAGLALRRRKMNKGDLL